MFHVLSSFLFSDSLMKMFLPRPAMLNQDGRKIFRPYIEPSCPRTVCAMMRQRPLRNQLSEKRGAE
jgi:hypothetical protein